MNVMKRKWTREQIDFPWDAIDDEHLIHLVQRFMRSKHTSQENNLFRYLLGAHNRIAELEAQRDNVETANDSPCVEDDGCPTEGAVLKRAWRKHTEQLDAVSNFIDAWVAMETVMEFEHDTRVSHIKKLLGAK
jgi:hypothetical protein